MALSMTLPARACCLASHRHRAASGIGDNLVMFFFASWRNGSMKWCAKTGMSPVFPLRSKRDGYDVESMVKILAETASLTAPSNSRLVAA